LPAKSHASTHSPCCCHLTSNHTNSTNCSPKGSPPTGGYMLSCLLLWLRHSSRQPTLSRKPASVQSSSFHFISLPALSLRLGHEPHTCNHTTATNSAHSTQGSFRSIPSSFSRQACSPPATLVVLACAVVRAAACHIFCKSHDGFQKNILGLKFLEGDCVEQKIRQALFGSAAPHVQSRIPRGLPSWFAPRYVPCLHSALLAHTLPPARGTHFVEATSFALGGSRPDMIILPTQILCLDNRS